MTNDLTIKQAVGELKAMKKHIEPYMSVVGVTAYDMAIKALEKQPKTGWIPVSERLPEKQITIGKYVFSEYVLGTEGYTIRRAYYNYTTKEWFDGNEEMEWTEITHWMPLPEETPKVESEDDG